jgi:hypothetical protein
MPQRTGPIPPTSRDELPTPVRSAVAGADFFGKNDGAASRKSSPGLIPRSGIEVADFVR